MLFLVLLQLPQLKINIHTYINFCIHTMWCPNFSKFVFRPHFTNLQAQTPQTSNEHTANYIKIPHFTFFTRVLKVP